MENERNKVVYSIFSSRGLSGKVSLYRRSIGKLPRFLLLRSVRMKWTSPSRIRFLSARVSPFHEFKNRSIHESSLPFERRSSMTRSKRRYWSWKRSANQRLRLIVTRGWNLHIVCPVGEAILVIFVRKRTRAPNESSSNSQGRAGHVPSGAQPSLMKNVGWLPRRSLNGAVVTEICKHRTALRWFEMDIGPGLLIPRSGLNFETMLNFWFD